MQNYRGIGWTTRDHYFLKRFLLAGQGSLHTEMLGSIVSLFNKYPIVAPVLSAGKFKKL